nr:queuosine precursor transporter [Desulfurococcales archaeon]
MAAAVKIDYYGNIGPLKFIVPSGTVAYAITFPITDIVDELYGKRRALYIVWGGLVAEVAMLGLFALILKTPPLEKEMVKRFSYVAKLQWRIVAASLAAYLASQHHDVWAFWKWREITHGKWLWVRNNASTMVSQLIDTVIFITIAFYGLYPNNVVGYMIVSQWLFKVGIAALDTPFVYAGVYFLRRA